MDKLKLLKLKYVKLTGSYDNFPKLIWLCWHGCPLQTMPSGLLMSTLVVIDMSNGHLEIFEVPTILNSLKKLQLKGCDKLVSIHNLFRLPKLDELSLWNCSSLTHLCKTIGDLKNLNSLYLTGCTKLWKYVNQPETMLPKQPLFSFPQSLTWVELSNFDLEFNSDVCVVFHAQSYINLHLAGNPFEFLPNNIDLKMLRTLNLYSCQNLKSLPCIPSTQEVLKIDWCTSLERVTFQSGRFTLKGFTYECCFKLFEVQGFVKLVPVADIDEADLCHMQWIKTYANHDVNLVGDEITKGRIWHMQMLYEYGIMSTYLQGIEDQRMPAYDFTSSSCFLSFSVPFNHEKNRVQGLNISCLYRSTVSDDTNGWSKLWIKTSNITKGLTWMYNPLVYCKPTIDEDVVWVSYWPIGNILDNGDEVEVEICRDTRIMIVNGCGASFVYMDNEKEKCDINLMKEEEVIGGDLSEFEVATGCYYLSRRDLFGIHTSCFLRYMFGDNIQYSDLRGWRKTHNSCLSQMLKDIDKTFLRITKLGVSVNSETEIDKIEKVVSNILGVKSVSSHKETGKLTVTGHVDPVEVVICLREFGNIVAEILSVKSIYD